MQEVKNRLEISFGKKVRSENEFLKFNINELDEVGIFQLNDIRQLKPVQGISIKRSGVGLVIIVEVK